MKMEPAPDFLKKRLSNASENRAGSRFWLKMCQEMLVSMGPAPGYLAEERANNYQRRWTYLQPNEEGAVVSLLRIL